MISKIMESSIQDTIAVHLMENGILTDEQHCFVPGRDCITQLLLCMEESTSMIEEGKNIDMDMFFNSSKMAAIYACFGGNGHHDGGLEHCTSTVYGC